MKSIISLIVLLLFINHTFSSNSRLILGDEEYGEGKGSSGLLGGYEKVEKEDLDDVQALVDKLEDDIQDLLELEDDCEIIVRRAEKQIVAGTNYQVDIKTCKPDKVGAVIKFFVPLGSEEPDEESLELIDDGTTTGSFNPVEDQDTLDAIEQDLEKIDQEIRDLDELDIDDDATITLVSAEEQVVAGYVYRVQLEIRGSSDNSIETVYIEYYKDLSDNISNIKAVDEDGNELGDSSEETTGSFNPVEDQATLDAIEEDLVQIDDEIRDLDELDIADEATIVFVSAEEQVVAGYVYRVKLRVRVGTDIEVVYIEYYKDLSGNISNIIAVDEDGNPLGDSSEEGSDCLPGGYCAVDDLDDVEDQVESIEDALRTKLIDAGFALEGDVEVEVVSAESQVVEGGVNYRVVINAGVVSDIEIEYKVDYEGDVITDSVELLTEPPTIEYGASDKITVDCPEGFTLEKGECVSDELVKEKTKEKEEKEKEQGGKSESDEESTTTEEPEEEEEYTVDDCKDGEVLKDGECVPESESDESDESAGSAAAGDADLSNSDSGSDDESDGSDESNASDDSSSSGGEDDGDNDCGYDYSPVCCIKAKSDPPRYADYASICDARTAGRSDEDCTDGTCPKSAGTSPVACTDDVSTPMCCGGTFYGNTCMAEQVGGFLDPLNNDECDEVKETPCSDAECCADSSAEGYPVKAAASPDNVDAACTQDVGTEMCCNGGYYANLCLANAEWPNPLENAECAREADVGPCGNDAADPDNMDGACTQDIGTQMCCNGSPYNNLCLANEQWSDPMDNAECAPISVVGSCGNAAEEDYGEEDNGDGSSDDESSDEATEEPVIGACTQQMDPLCCDGTTYSNPCVAKQEGGFDDPKNDEACAKGVCGFELINAADEYEGEEDDGGKKSKKDVITGAYSDCDETELEDVKKDVDLVKDDVLEELGVEDCEIEVIGAKKQVVAGINYQVLVQCGDNEPKEVYLYVDLQGNVKLVTQSKGSKDKDKVSDGGADPTVIYEAEPAGDEDYGEVDAGYGDSAGACTMQMDPICCNGKDYSNPCVAENEGGFEDAENNEDCSMGTCDGTDCITSQEYNPFCCEGTTYDNPSEARCDGIKCPRKECERGTCDSQTCACPYIYQPICCGDENYPNSCTAKCVGIENPDEECSAGKCEEDCACTREYNPYCCDDTTYNNPCLARCDGFKFINFRCDKGICEKDEPCFCPEIYNPVCCNKGEDNEKEYGNMCQAACDLKGDYGDDLSLDQCELGECEEDLGCMCTLQFDPVCCLGSKTFGNQCQAMCDGYSEDQCTSGACSDIVACTMEYYPLCCNGEDYANPCMAEADGIMEPAEKQDECELGECGQPSVCTAEYDPFCCAGQTYSNECMAKAAGYEDPANDCREGRCGPSICTAIYHPLCCEGETYASPCLAERAGIEAPAENNCLAGRCEDQLVACTADYNPVCCNGDREYSNLCNAEANGFLNPEEQCVDGTCISVCPCTNEYDPYCCDDKDFGNTCSAACKGYDDAENNDKCTKGECGSNGCMCTMDMNPICCDGKTYSNPCAAECDGIPSPAEYQEDRCVMGTCESQCICTQEINPVCCEDTDYPNPCTAKCNGMSPQQCSSGRCDQQGECICTREYRPYCCDDENYSNGCTAECDGKDITDESQCTRGTCDSQCACPLIIDPVCCTREVGNKGKEIQLEFDNQCVASCGVLGFEEDECVKGKCDDVGVCTLEYRPVCCEGEEFDNPCLARKDGGYDDAENNDKCEMGVCEKDECKCTRELRPVCCDGIDFDNKCVAECSDEVDDADEECTKGTCDDNICMCTMDYDPYCCNGKTYFNPCNAECQGGIDYPAEEQDECQVGRCEDVICACTREYDPICCNGIDYGNPCEAECDGVDEPAQDQYECSYGRCRDQDLCICTREYNPVCCTDKDGVELTFSNPCLAGCEGISNPIKKCQPGRCEDEGDLCKCTREYAPLCCNDKDYANPCLAECDGISEPAQDQDECRRGECDSGALCKCTKELNPYCCTDKDGEKIDYDNPCLARCDGQFAPEYFCQRGTCDSQPEACTLEYNPYCCNGKDYANPCFAEKDGGFEDAENNESCDKGKCCDICGCTKEINPICCDGEQYSNPCLAECDDFEDAENNDKCELGLCKNVCQCSREFNPYCCDDETYSNPCTAECAGFEDIENNDQCEQGRCSGGLIVCTMEYNPYCCDNVEYANPCLAEKQGGFLDPENSDKCFKGKCSEGGGGCTADYNPLCCSKTTYDNECEAEDAGFEGGLDNSKCKEGKCKNYSGKDKEVCTEEYNPICCEDKYGVKITYDNPCYAEVEGKVTPPAAEQEECDMGECESTGGDCECTKEIDTICCTDDSSDEAKEEEFDNPCLAECAGFEDALNNDKCVLGKCGECTCDRSYDPYCCNEIDSFNNACLAKCGLDLTDDTLDDVCVQGSCAAMGCECTKEYDPYCCDGKTFDNECVAECNGKDCLKDCEKGICADDAAGYGESQSTYTGIFSLGKPSGSSQWNIMIVIIQLCILAVCCLSLGLSISFCFKNPNKLIGNSQSFKAQSFGRDQ